MISNPDLADLVAYVTRRGAKLVLAGDAQQLQAVENGGGSSSRSGFPMTSATSTRTGTRCHWLTGRSPTAR
jgi:hypothetical protein